MDHNGNDDDCCIKCSRVIDPDDSLIIVDNANGHIDFYHMDCFFGTIEQVAKKYGYPKIQPTMKLLTWKFHLCEKCFRMMDTSKEKILIKRLRNGDILSYRHQKCPPDKELQYEEPKKVT